MKTIRRLLAAVASFKNHVDSLNRRAEVETTLLAVYAGKRGGLSRDECRKLAVKLGVPSAFQNKQALELSLPDPRVEEALRLALNAMKRGQWQIRGALVQMDFEEAIQAAEAALAPGGEATCAK